MITRFHPFNLYPLLCHLFAAPPLSPPHEDTAAGRQLEKSLFFALIGASPMDLISTRGSSARTNERDGMERRLTPTFASLPPPSFLYPLPLLPASIPANALELIGTEIDGL
mgnify:CR=1 FL=1